MLRLPAFLTASLAAFLLATFFIASPRASAAIVNVTASGVLLPARDGFGCLLLQADDGNAYLLDNTGTFTQGDRVFVQGSYNTSTLGVCGSVAVPRITTTLLRPGFAGIGTVIKVGTVFRLQTDDGRQYILSSSSKLVAGARIYAQGSILTNTSPATITGAVTGPAFSAFGRFTNLTAGNILFKSDAGVTYKLDRPGTAGLSLTQYGYVEGVLGATPRTGPTPITSTTARPAFDYTGVISSTGSGNVFVADGLLFNDTFTFANINAYPVGTRLFVRGLRTEDYDYGEPKVAGLVRQASIGTPFSGLGTLNTATKTVTVGSTTVALENTGTFPNFSFVYVAGTVFSTGPNTVTLSHNRILDGIIIDGTLQLGFECSPLLVGDSGGYYTVENLGTAVLYDHVRVMGGADLDASSCPVYTLIDNTIEVVPVDPCPLCQ